MVIFICYVWYRFLRLLKLGVISDPDQNRQNLTITFIKFYISSCIIKFWIDGEKFDLIALPVFEIYQKHYRWR